MKASFAAILTLICLSSELQSAVTLDFQADQLRTASGTVAASSSLFLIVADTSRNGFSSLLEGASLSVGSLLAGSDDRIIAKTDLSFWGDGAAQFNGSIELSSVTGWDGGDPVAIFWFPDLNLSSGALVAGNTYGSFTGPGSGGEVWETPGDNGVAQYRFYTLSGTTLGPGTFANSLGNASLTVNAVPEPGKGMLMLVGLSLLVFNRKRKFKS